MKKLTICSSFCILCTIFYSTLTAAQDGMPASNTPLQLTGKTIYSILESAEIAYEKNHWIDAFINYAELADSGHPLASSIAYHMWRHGEPLYKTEFKATLDQVKKWRSFP